MNPEISIVIPVYNRLKEFKHCLESLQNQTFQNFDVVVADDGSQEDVKSALPATLGSGPVNYLKIVHGGANRARNAGFQASKGSYLLFLDADIICQPQMLERMLKALKSSNNASYCYTSFKVGWKTFKLWDFSPERLKKMNYIHTSSLIRRRDFPGFDENIKRFQDWDLWLTLLEQGKVGVLIPEVLFKITPGGLMSSWLPKFVYTISWLKTKKIMAYHQAINVVKKKHGLN